MKTKRRAGKCPSCGLNTGLKKSRQRAVNAWNATGGRDRS